jgi:cytochrome c oxidase subunit 3
MAESLQTDITLPIGGSSRNASGWWGIWMLIITEASLFGYLLLIYFYQWMYRPSRWPTDGMPKLMMPGINTLILLSSSGFVWWAERCIKRDRVRFSLLPMAAAIVFGTTFVVVQLEEWHGKPFAANTHLYGSLFFTITGFHMLHVVIGLIILIMLWLWSLIGYFDSSRHTPVTLGALYWHFVDVVWLFVFAGLYLSPRIVGT